MSDPAVSSPLTLTDFPAAPITPSRLRRLVTSRPLWALFDQAVLSGGNFLTGLIVVRALPVAAYGEYGLVLTFILFLNNLHTALITFPLSLTAAVGDGTDLARHARRAMGLTLGLFVPLGIALAVATAVSSRSAVVPFAVLSLLLWQLQETARRSMMARLQNHRAIAGDVISYLGQAAVVLLVVKFGTLTVPIAFAIIAATSGAAWVIQSLQLRVFSDQPGAAHEGYSRSKRSSEEDRLLREYPPCAARGLRSLTMPRRQDVTLHWSLGKWVLLSNLVNVLTFYSAPWMLTYTHGKTDFALLSVVAMLLNASNPVLSTVSGLITPAVARANEQGGLKAARRAAGVYAVMGLALLLPYYGLLIAAPHWVLEHLKPGSKYAELSTPVRLYVGIYLLLYGTQVLASFLSGLGRTRQPFYAQATAAVVTAAVTLPLVVKFGVIGAAVGGLFPMAAQLLVCAYYARRVVPSQVQVGSGR
jgi:O-antigen/teichoic acid export membrane protein